jgi:hypothetical protein
VEDELSEFLTKRLAHLAFNTAWRRLRDKHPKVKWLTSEGYFADIMPPDFDPNTFWMKLTVGLRKIVVTFTVAEPKWLVIEHVYNPRYYVAPPQITKYYLNHFRENPDSAGVLTNILEWLITNPKATDVKPGETPEVPGLSKEPSD